MNILLLEQKTTASQKTYPKDDWDILEESPKFKEQY